MNNYKKWIGMMASLLLSGCQIPAAMIATGAGAMPAYEAPPRPHYDVPSQIIYSIDNSRFFTLENYSGCGGGQIYYNDTSNHIKTLLKVAISGFPGKFHIDGNSDVLVFPDSLSAGTGLCSSDRGCFLAIYYSLDGGRSFDWFHPWKLSGDRKKSYEMAKDITVTLVGRQLYLNNQRSAVVFTFRERSEDGGEYIKDGPKAVPHVHTPSGQDHLICDDSIHPKEIKK
jgi:hypothetical protein